MENFKKQQSTFEKNNRNSNTKNYHNQIHSMDRFDNTSDPLKQGERSVCGAHRNIKTSAA